MTTTHLQPTLLRQTLPGAETFAFRVILVLFGTLLLALSAQISVPMYPVPMTMQTFVVFVIGATYGARLALVTLAAYLTEGLLGLPVFAGGNGGIAVLAGPTGGYLLGFLLAAGIIGLSADHGWSRSPWKNAMAMLAGSVVIFLVGLFQLKAFTGFAWSIVLMKGAVPFLYGDVIKLLLAATAVPSIWMLIDHRSDRHS